MQLPKTSPLEDLAVVSGYCIWPTTLPSYTKVGARGILLSFLASPGTFKPTNHLRLTATSSS